MQHLQSALGVVAIIAFAFLISENPKAWNWRQSAIGLGVTLVLAVIILKVPKAEVVFGWINDAVGAVAEATKAGTAFVFGYVGGGALPFDLKASGNEFVLGFQALPVVLV